MENNEKNVENTEDYKKEYSQKKFFKKVNFNWKSAGSKVVEVALQLYYSLRDSDTPAWAKGVIIGALGYFISPFDLIPDVLPGIGYTDDFGVMLSAIAVVAIHIKPEHKAKAAELSRKLFNFNKKIDEEEFEA